MQAQLAAVIKSTGGAAGMTAEAVNGLANGLSAMTPFEDDAIVAGENMLLTFTNIGKDVFPATTETMLDMSQALGQDMKSSAMQLGKALNDPVKGVTALQRVGVTFTEEQKKMIEKMVETGDVAGAQKVILAELNKEFGGSAVAAGKTFAGSMEILKNTFGNLQEEIGGKLLPVLTPLIQQFAKMASDIIPVVAENMQFVIDKVLGLYNAFQSGGIDGVIADLKKNFGSFGETVGTVVQFVKDHFEEIKGALIGIGTVLAAAGIVAAVVGIAAAIMNPITLIIAAAALLGAAWAGNWGGIQEKTAAVIAFVQPLFQAFITNMQAIWQGLQPVFQAVGTVINAVIGALTPVFQDLFKQVQGGFVNLNPLINAFKTLWTALQPVISAVANVLGVVLVAAVGILSGVIGGLVNAIQPWITMIVGIVTGFVTMLTGYVNVIVGLFTGNMDLARTGSQQVFSGLNTIVTSIITGMVNTVKALISGFVTTFLGFFTKLGVDLNGTVTGIVANVVKWFSELPGKMVDVGKSIIQGIIDGIGQMIGALLNTLGDVADKIKNAVTGALNAPQTNPGMGVPGMAIGGSVFGGSPYIVGERGPELFVPGASGTIIPNNKLSTGGTTIYLGGITISGNADASTVKQAAYNGVMAAARAMGAL
jgi:phage-related protein